MDCGREDYCGVEGYGVEDGGDSLSAGEGLEPVGDDRAHHAWRDEVWHDDLHAVLVRLGGVHVDVPGLRVQVAPQGPIGQTALYLGCCSSKHTAPHCFEDIPHVAPSVSAVGSRLAAGQHYLPHCVLRSSSCVCT